MTSGSDASLVSSAFAHAKEHRRALWEQLDSRTLDNGARVHVLPQGNHGIAAVEIWANVGAGDEPAPLAGISHLLEHMMFRGTHDVPDGEFDIRVQALGARANAWTWYDTTAYTTILGADHVEKLLALEADRFANLHIDDAVFQAERDVVLNERALTADSNPNTLAQEHLDRMLFGEGAYARPVIGYRENIAAFTREQLSDWYAQFYAPPALDILIVGDVSVADTHRLVADTFGAIPAGPPPSKAGEMQVTHHLGQQDRIQLAVSEPLVLMAWGMEPSADRRAVLTWRLLSEMLAFGRGGWLRTALEHDRKLALYQDVYVQEHRLGHSVVWEATPRSGVTHEALSNAFYATLSAFVASGISAEAMNAAKIRIVSDWASHSAPWQLLQSLGDALHTTGDAENFMNDFDILASISAKDVRSLAARLGDPASNVLLFVEPESA